jgi:hypothetical protein
VQPQPRLALERSELLNEIGRDHVLNDIDEALAAAGRHVGPPHESPSKS